MRESARISAQTLLVSLSQCHHYVERRACYDSRRRLQTARVFYSRHLLVRYLSCIAYQMLRREGKRSLTAKGDWREC